MRNRRSIGLDVHARSVVGCAIDEETGEVHRRRLSPDNVEIEAWIRSLPQPFKVTYEAGSTGFGLARHLLAAGIDTVIAAPSKLQRPAGDRVKTDARDALHLARLLKLGEIVEVTVPSVEREAARDLARGREDARADVMRSRPRVSKLLLRHGIVYSDGSAWTQKHDLWLRSQKFDSPAIQIAYDSAYEAMLLTADRRDRLDDARPEPRARSGPNSVDMCDVNLRDLVPWGHHRQTGVGYGLVFVGWPLRTRQRQCGCSDRSLLRCTGQNESPNGSARH